ncbi:MAG: hypothetical protein KDB22_03525, partial [Planctomycetales bacterium]|nr:hypothetical protein [Planctomycetales bacterium]
QSGDKSPHSKSHLMERSDLSELWISNHSCAAFVPVSSEESPAGIQSGDKSPTSPHSKNL